MQVQGQRMRSKPPKIQTYLIIIRNTGIILSIIPIIILVMIHYKEEEGYSRLWEL